MGKPDVVVDGGLTPGARVGFDLHLRYGCALRKPLRVGRLSQTIAINSRTFPRIVNP